MYRKVVLTEKNQPCVGLPYTYFMVLVFTCFSLDGGGWHGGGHNASKS